MTNLETFQCLSCEMSCGISGLNLDLELLRAKDRNFSKSYWRERCSGSHGAPPLYHQNNQGAQRLASN